MAKLFPSLTPAHEEFILNQKIFFVATAGPEGRVNLSPKGMDSIRILNQNKLMWLNTTGSGNETAAHLLLKNRITLMFCSFEGKPLILRLYGQAKAHHHGDAFYEENISLFPPLEAPRQIFEMEIQSVQTSCGYAVPFMEFKSERDQLNQWAKKQGKERISKYWIEKNSKTIDGYDTGMKKE